LATSAPEKQANLSIYSHFFQEEKTS